MPPGYGFYSIQGINEKRAPITHAIVNVNTEHVPNSFNMALWQEQAARYHKYWSWFDGTLLSETRSQSTDGEDILKYPLGINPIRNFARKHATVLMGEETFDSPHPLVKTKVSPKPLLAKDQEFTKDDKILAQLAQNIINTVWVDSKGRGKQVENATLSQFLGGCVFQLSWMPQKSDEMQIPIMIKNIMPDFFLPVWTSDDYWNLLEAFVVYRIPARVAELEYGFERSNKMGWVTYCEHWTKKQYSLYLNGEPIKSDFAGKEITYDQQENPFGFVPFVYIPHLREGTFWGHGHVEDVEGLVKELNARYADIGDAIRDSVHRKRYTRDLSSDPRTRKIDVDTMAVDIGMTNITTKAKPDIWTEDPPQLSEGVVTLPESLWKQTMREGNIGDIAFGEDEGSQRSALTLAFRMWPITSHSRIERTFWTDGLNTIAKFILKMVQIKTLQIPFMKKLELEIPDDFLLRLSFSQDWLPQIPRDREQLISEIILRSQSGLLSAETALKMFGDVEYVEEEIKLIKEWLAFKASLSMVDKDKVDDSNPPTEVVAPGISTNPEKADNLMG